MKQVLFWTGLPFRAFFWVIAGSLLLLLGDLDACKDIWRQFVLMKD